MFRQVTRPMRCLPQMAQAAFRLSAVRLATPAVSQLSQSFATSRLSLAQGIADNDLLGSLKSELKYESSVDSSLSPEAKAFLKRQDWKLVDDTTVKEVTMTRSFGTELLTLKFSTDITEQMPSFDDGMDEEGESGEDPTDEELYDPGFTGGAINLIIEKKGAHEGALDIGLLVEAGSFSIGGINYCSNVSLLKDRTAEGDWQRRGLYLGPDYLQLDEQLRETFHAYLKERGIDEELSSFVIEYASIKEGKEYKNWLKGVIGFVGQ